MILSMNLRVNLSAIVISFLLLLWLVNSKDDNFRFPENFSIGAATASYQVEGGWDAGGKGENVWDWFTHLKPSRIFDKSNGDIACDSYQKYKEDVQILKNIGFHHYRFSISWSRILPNGFAYNVSNEGVKYYKDLLDELNSKGIRPYVTLYHWDHPQVLERLGGWTNELMVEWFADYARVVFRELGPKVKMFLTINEPSVFCGFGYGSTQRPPGINLPGLANYLCVHNVLKAHARAYHIYDKEFRPSQNGQISIVLHCTRFYPDNPNDTELDNVAFQFSCGWTAHPIFSKEGDYPRIMKDIIEKKSLLQGWPQSRLPIFSSKWISYIKGTADFFALNHYTSRIVRNQTGYIGPFFNDLDINLTVDPNWPTTESVYFFVVPEGFRSILNKIKEEYGNPPVHVTENGFSNSAPTDDIQRLNGIKSYLKALLTAIHQDGCNVKAYTVWSLLDNFEWDSGYSERFGIVHVDFNDSERKRTLKQSAVWLKNVLLKRDLNTVDNSVS